jgi:LacI family transcriptional regulator
VATLEDVARRAGVTAATVSNVLSGRVGVREATRQRVQDAIAEVGYRPNLVARGLARGKTYTLAVLAPTLTNPFFAEVIETMEAVADAHDYQLLLALSHGQPHQGARHLERFASRWVDGFIILGGAAPSADVDALSKTGKPVVLSVWGTDAAALEAPRVEIDFRRAGELATQHLLDRGHRRIATILEVPVQQTRFEGFQAALHQAGMHVLPEYVQRGDSSFASGQRAMSALLALPKPPTAVFAGNDAMALGAMEAAYVAGVAVPDKLAVVGVDDIPGAEYAHPPLTTVRIPTRELADTLIALMLRLLAGEACIAQEALIPTLVPRQST